MKCSIIRDLLPLYGSDNCREGSRDIVSRHLEGCLECRELYESMKQEVGLKVSMKAQEDSSDNSTFWSRYYGSLLLKGVVLFLLVYGVLVAI